MLRPGFFAFALGLLASACGANPPTDDEMILRFQENRPQLTELRDMALEEHRRDPEIKIIELDDLEADWKNDPPEHPRSDLSKLTEDRRARYVSLFTDLKIEQISVLKNTVDILAARDGFSFGGWAKSFVWDEELGPGAKVLASLDYPLAKEGYAGSSWFLAYRRIENGWYLHYSEN
jgi:hypothetical protein